MKREFFIDTENVGTAWIRQISPLAPKDMVYVFVSNAELMRKLKNSIPFPKKQVEFVECIGMGKNDMDIYIAGFVARKSARHFVKREYVIVSNDKGYEDFIAGFSRNRWAVIRRQGVYGQSFQDFYDKVEPILTDMRVDPDKIMETAVKFRKRDERAKLHRDLVKEYGDEKGTLIYRAIRPHMHFLINR
ncbi:MAG: hypothetical protein IJG57_05570 [Firmicutes bacterium]|nr:hypothetical protein [Bacillota bacterium]